jgi:hypothetical protein
MQLTPFETQRTSKHSISVVFEDQGSNPQFHIRGPILGFENTDIE